MSVQAHARNRLLRRGGPACNASFRGRRAYRTGRIPVAGYGLPGIHLLGRSCIRPRRRAGASRGLRPFRSWASKLSEVRFLVHAGVGLTAPGGVATPGSSASFSSCFLCLRDR